MCLKAAARMRGLFRHPLNEQINMAQPLVRLAGLVN